MDFLRSEDMGLYEASIPKDSAWETMDAFGKLGIIHFVDLNKDTQPFNLTYVHSVKRCEEALRN
jgi:hypothetical protein